MKIIKWTLGGLLGLMLVLFLHYTLPSRDIVQIVGTDVKRMDVGNSPFWANSDAGTNKFSTRDVRFINVAFPDGEPYVYRNEDTDWGWPPYLKFNSGTVTAEAQSLAKQEDVWVAITHYGWRIQLITIFPNAISIKQVSGPDAFLFPWFNVIFLTVLAAILFGIYRLISRFKAQQVDPVIDSIEEAADGVSDYTEQVQSQTQDNINSIRSRIRAWLKKWFGEVPK